MTDRELLEKAAIAANMDYDPESAWHWNPIEDDGQALRLAVKLKIDVKHYEDYVVAWFDGGYIGTGKFPYGTDPCTSTRMAIVTAAAAIGETL